MTESRSAPIPFNRPFLRGREFEYIGATLSNMHISGEGGFTARCQSILEQALGTPRALLTTSCTHSLEMSALLLEIQPGDEVIVPSFTFSYPQPTPSCCEGRDQSSRTFGRTRSI